MNPDLTRVRNLVHRYGWNTTCYQLIQPRLQHWFSDAGDAVIGYLRRNGVRVVAGAPVCPPNRLSEVLREFETASPERVCYFGAEERLFDLLHADSRYSVVSLGAQPMWKPSEYVTAFDHDRSLRAQRNRATNKGTRIEEWSSERVRWDPRLQQILVQWLATRGLPPLHFLVEYQTLDHGFGRRFFVAILDEAPVAFVTLCPAPARHAWLTEQFVRGAAAPNGTIELLLRTAIAAIGRDGAALVTMGIVPLSEQGTYQTNPLWLRSLCRIAKSQGSALYDFEGLEWFKNKFHPTRWESVYVISQEPRFSFSTLWAIAAAFCDDSPLRAVGRGLFRTIHR